MSSFAKTVSSTSFKAESPRKVFSNASKERSKERSSSMVTQDRPQPAPRPSQDMANDVDRAAFNKRWENEAEAVSGGVVDRPGMLALLAFLRKRRRYGETVVLIDDISRLARDIKAHIDLRSAISEAGGRLESPSIEFGEDSDSILVENLLASVSQHQRQKNAEQTANRMRSRLLNGYWTFSCPPGYRYEHKSGQGKLLVRDEPLASIIAEGMEKFASGMLQTQAEVKRFYERFPEFPKTRFGTVTNENVNRILTRLLYAGYLERPQWGVKLTKAHHEPLVSLETFERIQKRLKEGAKVPARANLDESFPLRGFVLCGDCGKPLTACWSKSKTGKKHPYYMCFNKDCVSNRKSIQRSEIEGEFEKLLSSIEPAPVMVDLLKAMVSKIWDAQKDCSAALRQSFKTKITDTEKQVSVLLDRIMEATNNTVVTRYEQRIAELERNKAVLLERMQNEGKTTATKNRVFELALRFISNPYSLWKNGSFEHKKNGPKTGFLPPPLILEN